MTVPDAVNGKPAQISGFEEIRESNGQRRSQARERVQGRIPRTHLNPSDIASIQIGLLGQSLLRPALRVP